VRSGWSKLADSHSYGIVLALIVVTFLWAITFPTAPWARAVLVILQSATLLAALRTSGVAPRLLRLALGVCTLAVAGSVAAVASNSIDGGIAVALVSVALVSITPLAILRGAASFTVVTVRTVTGALCIYLLIGMLFAALYGVIDEASGGSFFVQQSAGNYADYLYYSYVTQTTVGFGDLTTASGAGRALTTLQALLGQIYLVTVVAMIVANLGRSRGRAQDELEGATPPPAPRT
jgi:uncharacterized membrane protein